MPLPPLLPAGTPHASLAPFTSVNLPSAPVDAPMMGEPEAGASHGVHSGLPGVMGAGVAFGT